MQSEGGTDAVPEDWPGRTGRKPLAKPTTNLLRELT